mgnify:CR=1 FL=1
MAIKSTSFTNEKSDVADKAPVLTTVSKAFSKGSEFFVRNINDIRKVLDTVSRRDGTLDRMSDVAYEVYRSMRSFLSSGMLPIISSLHFTLLFFNASKIQSVLFPSGSEDRKTTEGDYKSKNQGRAWNG